MITDNTIEYGNQIFSGLAYGRPKLNDFLRAQQANHASHAYTNQAGYPTHAAINHAGYATRSAFGGGSRRDNALMQILRQVCDGSGAVHRQLRDAV